MLNVLLRPNLVTLIALIWNASGAFLVGISSPTLTFALPKWVFLYCALCLFVYQTLDAIDGKQARRTGSSSPLGQMFDHG
jgi:phosphatidylglycerophosphate synthase